MKSFTITRCNTSILLLTAIALTACGNASRRAEKEYQAQSNAMARIQPLGSGAKNLTKEEAYLACIQKAAVHVAEAGKIEEFRQSIEYRNKSGGFAQGLAQAMEMDSAKSNAKNTAIRSCLIDYGYIMR